MSRDGERASGKCESLCMIACRRELARDDIDTHGEALAICPSRRWSSDSKIATRMRHTRAMRNHSLVPYLVDPLLLHQPQYSMERASNLERPNLLEILRLEEQPELRLRRLLPLPLCALQRLWRLWSGSEIGKRGVGEHRCGVDVRFDQAMRGANGVARQWQVYG